MHMTSQSHTRRRFQYQSIAILMLLLTGVNGGVLAGDGPGPFQALEKRLIDDGFDPARTAALFADPGVTFAKRGVSAYFMHNEAKLNYKQFTRVWNISSARKYMQQHRDALDHAQQTYGVDKEVITAIILVETKLGTYTGKSSVINILATLAAMTDAGPREIIWQNLPDNDRRMSRNQFEKKADRKSSWAYRELKAFLQYTEKERMDPITIKGSYAGAMGISQFMPSNIAPYGRDGDNDGKIDLFVHADAISSIASYLKHFGWKPGLSRDQAYKVVYHYNHSKYYVNTILDIADKLKG
jgi:membrane-bound lytic murein transglycosylase B